MSKSRERSAKVFGTPPENPILNSDYIVEVKNMILEITEKHGLSGKLAIVLNMLLVNNEDVTEVATWKNVEPDTAIHVLEACIVGLNHEIDAQNPGGLSN